LVGFFVALVGEAFPLVGDLFALVRSTVALVDPVFEAVPERRSRHARLGGSFRRRQPALRRSGSRPPAFARASWALARSTASPARRSAASARCETARACCT
jgi:hypothetical protein